MENRDIETIWQEVVKRLQSEIGQDAAEMWLLPIKPLLYKNKALTLEIPNQVWFQTLRERYETRIIAILSELVLEPATIEYTIPMGGAAPKPVLPPEPVCIPPHHEIVDKTAPFPNRLNQLYTFESFIEGPSNRFAYKASQAVVQKMGERSNNPFVIHSTPGLGKTHLLHAIGNEIMRTKKGAKVLYMSGEEFVSEYIESLKNKVSESFRRKYRTLDCFLMDDIQFVVGKDASEKEFFYTFNALFDSKKQIVLTSDRTPSELDIDKRLASRLLSGIVAEIKQPDIETRIAILRKKRETHKFNIPDDVITFIGTKLKTSIREMEGSLIRLDSYCGIHGTVPTVEIAKEILADMIPPDDRLVPVGIDIIKKVVAEHFHVNVEDLCSQKRAQTIAWPRQVAMYLATQLTDMSFPEIGRAFERDHSTAVYARDRVKKEIDENPFFSPEINLIINEVKAVDKK